MMIHKLTCVLLMSLLNKVIKQSRCRLKKILGTVKAGQICFSHILQKQFTPLPLVW